MKNNKDTNTRTLIRIAASFDESGNAVAAVDFYGEENPKKQLDLLGTLVFEAFVKTDAHTQEIFDGKPKAFPGSKSKLNACLSADGKAHIFSEETEKGTAGELLRCAVDGWIAKNPKYSSSDVARVGIRHAEKRHTNSNSVFSAWIPSEIVVMFGKTLPRFVRVITALRLIASVFKGAACPPSKRQDAASPMEPSA